MANTANSVITAQLAVLGKADLSAVTACSTRGKTATAGLAAANIFVLVPLNATADQRISKISVKATSTSITAPTAAQIVQIWHWDATNAHLIDEILVSALTPSTVIASFKSDTLYDDLVLPIGHALYASTTVTTTASTTALEVTAHGASM